MSGEDERLPKIPMRPGEDEQMTSTESSGLSRKKRKKKEPEPEIGTAPTEE